VREITRSAIVSFVLTVLCLFALPAYAKYNGGTGDPCDPYQINDPCQLNAIGTDPCDWGKHFVLTADIDLSAYTGEQFNIIAPDANDIEIGFQGTAFTGSFDGNGHTISNFTYTNIGGNIIGLFGYVGDPCSYAVVKDLTLADPSIVAEAGNYVGSVIGWLENGIITGCGVEGGGVTGGSMIGSLVGHNAGSINHCYATGNVIGGDNASNLGGLAGYNDDGSISNCYATGSVSGGGLSIGVGGLVGHNRHGSISNCYATGNVSGGDNSNNLGGLIGYNDDGSISGCYATGDVSDGDYPYYFGGLVGYNSHGSINDCYATGSISGGSYSYYFGGLVGYNEAGSISNCYAICSISGKYYFSGLVGYNWAGDISNCFWDIETSDQTLSHGGFGRTTAQMKQASTYNGWGNDMWTIEEDVDYPHLTWEEAAGDMIDNIPDRGYSGSGTQDDPFIIVSADNMVCLTGRQEDWDKWFELANDIDMSAVTGYLPPGNFSGRFNGNGHRIANLTVEEAGSLMLGLFGYMGSTAEINNLRMVNSVIIGYDYLGGLVGYNRSGSISNCSVTGSVSGDSGLGGMVGYNDSGSISNCYATSSVSGDNYLGGLTGWNLAGGSIINCYATGNVLGGTLANCLGGLVGYDYSGSYISSFWNTTVDDSCLSGVGNRNPDPNGVIGETAANMQIQSTFTDKGWDFVGEDVHGTDDTWRMCVDGIDYPKLSLEFLTGDIACPDGVEINDLMYLIDYWLEDDCPGTPGCPIADINADNEINLKDFTDLAANWLLP